jgi:tryptophanyl-tRNA synthetase
MISTDLMSHLREFKKQSIVDAHKSKAEEEWDLKNIEDFDRDSINMWVFNYPILMAADIIGYDCEAVPVGKDQIQHLEMTREISSERSIKHMERKYSRSQRQLVENRLEHSQGSMVARCRRAMITSSEYSMMRNSWRSESCRSWQGLRVIDEKKKNPDDCNVFNLYRVFATPEETAALRVKYESENIGFGYGHAKTDLLKFSRDISAPYREARENLLQNPEIVEAKLAEWAKIMNARLDAKMKVVKEVVGVN